MLSAHVEIFYMGVTREWYFQCSLVANKARLRQNKSQRGPLEVPRQLPLQWPGGPLGDQLRGTLGARLWEPFIDFYCDDVQSSILIDPENII